MCINLPLGFLLTVFPSLTINLVFLRYPLNNLYIQILGIVLFMVGVIQYFLIKNEMFDPKTITVLGILAVLPAIALNFAIVAFSYYFSTTGLVLNITGTVYMYILGAYYFVYVKRSRLS